MFELNQLEHLLAFAEYETLSKAAEKLLLSQPALTRSMQKLEEALGVTLFERTKNKIKLNDNGLLAVECAEKILYDVQNMMERIRVYDRSKRTIYIGSCAPAPLWKLSPVLAGLYPEQTISSELKNAEQVYTGLKNGIYNLIIAAEPIKDDDVICREYCSEHLMLSLPPAHPLAMYKSVSFSDLAGETMLLYSEIGFWHDICKEKMPDTNFIVQHERSDFCTLVANTALPSFTSDMASDEDTGTRVMIPISDKEANPTFFCAIAKKDKLKFQALLKQLE